MLDLKENSNENEKLTEHLIRPGTILKVVSRYAEDELVVDTEGKRIAINSIWKDSWEEPMYDPEVSIYLVEEKIDESLNSLETK